MLLLLLFSFCLLKLAVGQNLEDDLKIKLEEILADKQIPGAMISIVSADSTLFSGGIGYANIKEKIEVSENHTFRLGSISKSFVALGILKLVDQGKMNLSDKLHDIDTSLKLENKWKDQFPITVEQILEHTAGFDDVQKDAHYNTTDKTAPTCAELIDIHKNSLYARWQPGERMAYSNPGYVVAGHLIEKISNVPYAEFLKEEILNPIGMNQSGFFFKASEGMNIVEGYKRMGGQLSQVGFKSVQGGPASDFCSNAQDMASFLKFMLSSKTTDREELITPDLLYRMIKPQTSIAAKNGFEQGYGLGTISIWTNNYNFHGHDGGIDGFSSMYLFSKEANFALAVSINSEADSWPLVKEILTFYLGPNTYEEKSTQIITKEIINEFEGFYNFKSPRSQSFHFIQKMFEGNSLSFQENKMLVKSMNGQILDTLYHKGENEFYRKDEGIPFVKLLNENDKSVLWLGNHYAEKGSKGLRMFLNFALFGIMFFSFLYFFVGGFWLIKDSFDKAKERDGYNVLLWFTSLSLLVFIASFIFVDEFYKVNDGINFGSILLSFSSGLFVIAAIISFVKSFKLEDISKFVRWFQRITSASLLALAIYCMYNGLMDVGI